jgi:WD40 repeat protein
LASASTDRTVRLWNVTTGEQLAVFKGHTAGVSSVAMAPDGKTIVSAGETLKRWETNLPPEPTTLSTAEMARDPISVAVSPDDKLLAAADGSKVLLFEFPGKHKHALSHKSKSVAFSPDGTLLASGGAYAPHQTVKLWDTRTGEQIEVFNDCGGLVVFSPDGKKLAACGRHSRVVVLNLADRQPGVSVSRTQIGKGMTNPHALVFSPEGRLLVGGVDRRAKIWDAVTGEERATLEHKKGYVSALAFSPDGETLAAGSFASVTLWNTNTWQPHTIIQKAHRYAVSGVAFSPDGKTLASVGGHYGSVKLWKVATGDEVGSPAGRRDMGFSVTFSSDVTRMLVVGGYGAVEMWQAATEEEVLLRSP